jgi:uncharacterized protein YkwD
VTRGGRTLVVLAISSVALFELSPSASPSQLSEPRLLSGLEQNLLREINQARAAHGAPPLRIGVRLQRAARAHSRAMARSGSFAHGDWYRRLRRHGVRARALGETLAWGVGAKGTAAAIVGMWLDSPPHRETMLHWTFRRIGIGVAVGTMAGYPRAKVATADYAG